MNLPLRLLLLVAIVLSTLTTLQNIVALAAPLPEQEAPAALNLDGYTVIPMASSPRSRGRDFSHGTIQRFRLQPKEGGMPVSLTLMPVRSRNDEALQMARLSEIDPAFRLQARRLLTIRGDHGGGPARGADELALGMGPKGSRSKPVSRLQTCLTPSGLAGVTSRSIHEELKANRFSKLSAADFSFHAARFLGLRPNSRWECLAVQLETQADNQAQPLLLHAWTSLKPRLIHNDAVLTTTEAPLPRN
jgi:hypothetical protein